MVVNQAYNFRIYPTKEQPVLSKKSGNQNVQYDEKSKTS
ncbi:helix-turn-helix domain-containing protein [Peribacillus sp. NPDC094092]